MDTETRAAFERMDGHFGLIHHELQLLRGLAQEHGERLDRVEGRLDSGERRMDRVEAALTALRREVRDGFDRIDRRFAAIDLRFESGT